ncbi:MAG: hypothetical protein H6710_11405 [Myxococcales bacterium]|nr:hypothetical protein [Myxococcales bacterium]
MSIARRSALPHLEVDRPVARPLLVDLEARRAGGLADPRPGDRLAEGSEEVAIEVGAVGLAADQRERAVLLAAPAEVLDAAEGAGRQAEVDRLARALEAARERETLGISATSGSRPSSRRPATTSSRARRWVATWT